MRKEEEERVEEERERKEEREEEWDGLHHQPVIYQPPVLFM
jgi:hypothetical protein